MSAINRHNVTVAGLPTGQPMVFAHGFGCDQHMWRQVTPYFADRHRLVLFDYLGAGESDVSAYDPARYDSLDGYAQDVVDICTELGLREVIFVGHSVSSMIGLLAARKQPDLFAALVMVGPSPRYIDDADYTGGFTAADVDELLASLSSNYLGWSTAMAPAIMGLEHPAQGAELTESFCRADPAIAEQFARVTFLSDNRGDLSQVSVPTLVLQCSNDVIAPVSVGEFISREMPNATLTMLDATGHCPHMSAPDQTAEAILEFLSTSSVVVG